MNLKRRKTEESFKIKVKSIIENGVNLGSMTFLRIIIVFMNCKRNAAVSSCFIESATKSYISYSLTVFSQG
jgi:NDP-sugar pyrophosphorylase family protein